MHIQPARLQWASQHGRLGGSGSGTALPKIARSKKAGGVNGFWHKTRQRALADTSVSVGFSVQAVNKQHQNGLRQGRRNVGTGPKKAHRPAGCLRQQAGPLRDTHSPTMWQHQASKHPGRPRYGGLPTDQRVAWTGSGSTSPYCRYCHHHRLAGFQTQSAAGKQCARQGGQLDRVHLLRTGRGRHKDEALVRTNQPTTLVLHHSKPGHAPCQQGATKCSTDLLFHSSAQGARSP